MTNKAIITLNVGGQKFTTFEDTLRQSNYFVNLLDGDMKNYELCDSGIFVDRSGALFGYVLQYLRTGHIFADSETLLNSLKQEADFYQLSNMLETIETTDAQMKEARKLKLRLISADHLANMRLIAQRDRCSLTDDRNARETYTILKCIKKSIQSFEGRYTSYTEVPNKYLLAKEDAQ